MKTNMNCPTLFRSAQRRLVVLALIFGPFVVGTSLVPDVASAATKAAVGARCEQAEANRLVRGKSASLRCAKDGSKYTWVLSSPGTTVAPAVSVTSGDIAAMVGSWRPGVGSQAGYRMREFLAGGIAKTDAVGRTSKVTGEVVIDGTSTGLSLRSVLVSADVSSMKSDQEKRDMWLRTSALQTDTFPTATFEMSKPMTVAVPKDGQVLKFQVDGDLTVHGVRKKTTVNVEARRTGNILDLVGNTRLMLTDFNIDPPVIPGMVSTDDTGLLEFILVLSR
jgi:polyisoprenoid-binding protein YceI